MQTSMVPDENLRKAFAEIRDDELIDLTADGAARRQRPAAGGAVQRENGLLAPRASRRSIPP